MSSTIICAWMRKVSMVFSSGSCPGLSLRHRWTII